MKRLTQTWISRILLLVVTCVLAGVLAQATNAQGGTEGTGTGNGAGTSTSDTATEPGTSTSDASTTSGESGMAEGTGTTGTTSTDTQTNTVVGVGVPSDNDPGTNAGNQPLLWILGALLVLGIGALLLRRRPPAET